jgi:DNA-binding GntR family transcriptional regulator
MEFVPAVKNIGRIDLLADRAYREVRDAILAGKLPPGRMLSVPELAQQMGISRSPVREGVQRLIHDGLATHVPHRGAEVSRFEPSRLQDLYVVRELLEGVAARLATERLDPARTAELREVLSAHERAIRGRSSSGPAEIDHIQLDMKFHRITRQIASNEHLSAFLDMLQGQSHLAYHVLWSAPDAPRLAYEEHKRIFQAMLEGDPGRAEQAAREHIAGLRARLLQAHATPAEEGLRPDQRVRSHGRERAQQVSSRSVPSVDGLSGAHTQGGGPATPVDSEMPGARSAGYPDGHPGHPAPS